MADTKRLAGMVAAVALPLALAACVKVNVPEAHFFYPNARLEAEGIVLPTAPDIPNAEILSLPYAGGSVAATRVRTGRADAPLILYCGGNMFRRSAAGAEVARDMSPLGDVLMFDYPGYGETPGEANFASFRTVGAIIATEARARADAEGRKLVAWGHSLGGPVCAEIARAAQADMLVLETTTPSTHAAVDEMLGLWKPIARVTLAPALETVDIPATLDGYPGKVVVLEAGKDDTLPPALSRRLARALEAQGNTVERIVFPAAGHNDVGRQPDFVARLSAALN